MTWIDYLKNICVSIVFLQLWWFLSVVVANKLLKDRP